MKETNPEIESQLNALAEMCCESLREGESVAGDRSKALLKALLMSGFVRSSETTLQAELEARAKAQCGDAAADRGGALLGITRQLQHTFDGLQRWETTNPKSDRKTQASSPRLY